MDREALAARLLALFVEELDEHVRAMNTDLLALEADPRDAERLRSLFRTAHTLKGAARTVSANEVEAACHAVEEVLAEVREGRRPLDAASIQVLLWVADALADAGARLREGRPLAEASVATVPARLARLTTAAPPPAEPSARTEEAPAPARPSSEPARPAAAVSEPSPPVAADPVPVRVNPERLDELLATAGEVLTLARRAEMRSSELRALDEAMAPGWGSEWRRLPMGSLPAEDVASPTDAPRGEPAGGDERLRRLGERIRHLARDARTDARHLGQTAEALVAQVRGLRMRPVQEALEGLPRIVRDLATTAGKEVQLVVEGGAVEVDRGVIEVLREAVIPVVRNAVDHGLEPPAERERAGKPPQGRLLIRAELGGDRVAVTIEDDGAGVDSARLRERLAAAGLPAPEDDHGLAEALLSGGVSSLTSATAISGRGVGLDIVRAAMERVRGGAALEWTPGAGTRVRLEFPPSLASVRALLFGVGSQVLAVPTLAVERLTRVPVEALRSVEGRPVLATPEGPLPVVSLARILGPPLAERPLAGVARVMVLGSRGMRAALVVDELLGETELMLRPLATGRAALPLISGAAMLASGTVAPLLDAAAVVAAAQASGRAAPRVSEEEEDAGPPGRILVVDDSLTTRTLEQSLLEAAGYTVSTAVDGLDAWRLLQEAPFDLVVSDVEMPRMDGFRLCETVRASARLRQLPVVLVTARESPEDRARGLEVGADAYLPKSSFDQEQLLDTIRQLLE